ncbi:MAG: dihydrodipicolinate synthase family protein [Opitutales bacterium]|nr:dihydrodipicolinate synthase family protein [Opitutales bacterium]
MHSEPTATIPIWSATPTPLDDSFKVNLEDVRRLMQHHIDSGISGVMLAGTSGEGPWLPNAEIERLVAAAADAAGKDLKIAAQVSDNSANRILENIDRAAKAGAQYAVIAPPYYLMNASPENLLRLYRTAIRESGLPVIIYNIGGRQIVLTAEILEEIYAEPNVVMVKDSSADPRTRSAALKAQKTRPELKVLTGDEFKVIDHLEAGGAGMMLGGAALTGRMNAMLVNSFMKGDKAGAHEWQSRINSFLLTIYGGPEIPCWLPGLKYALVRLGVFSSWSHTLNYPFGEDQRQQIDRAIATERSQILG